MIYKMAAILADDTFKCIFLNKNDKIPIQMSLKLVPMSPIDNNLALVQEMATNRRQAITWTSDDPVHWRIYAALGGDELKLCYSFIRSMRKQLVKCESKWYFPLQMYIPSVECHFEQVFMFQIGYGLRICWNFAELTIEINELLAL